MIHVEKYHGTGNDFIVVGPERSVPDRRAFARRYCDRTDGIEPPTGETGKRGADGVLFLALEEQYSPPRVIMTLVQPDGSVAQMCGNGVRCAAHWAGSRTGATELMIDTLAGTRHARIEDDTVHVEMGVPTFDPDIVPLEGTSPLIEGQIGDLSVTAVNTGVPHAVAMVESVDAIDLEAVGPIVRNASVFPEGANLTLGSLRNAAPPAFDQRTYERGVEGETASCGTGAVAVVAVARRLGLIDDADPAAVSLPGGTVTVDWRGDDAIMRGPATRSYSTELPVAEPGVIG